MTLKVKATAKPQPKLFIGGKPKDFELRPETGTSYKIACAVTSTGNYSITASGTICSKGLREAGEHFLELADMMDGKIAA